MSKSKEIQISWSVDDVYSIRPDLTEDQAMEVLQNVKDNHDADIGVCWETLNFWADSMFPKGEHWGNFTVEITETLQLQVTIEANTHDDAVKIVKRAYQAGFHILGAEHLTRVDFTEIDSVDSPEEMGESHG